MIENGISKEVDVKDFFKSCRFKGGGDDGSWEQKPKGTPSQYSWSNRKVEKPERYTTPELLPRLSTVPRQSHDPLGVD